MGENNLECRLLTDFLPWNKLKPKTINSSLFICFIEGWDPRISFKGAVPKECILALNQKMMIF
jgi:hypothetical protein